MSRAASSAGAVLLFRTVLRRDEVGNQRDDFGMAGGEGGLRRHGAIAGATSNLTSCQPEPIKVTAAKKELIMRAAIVGGRLIPLTQVCLDVVC